VVVNKSESDFQLLGACLVAVRTRTAGGSVVESWKNRDASNGAGALASDGSGRSEALEDIASMTDGRRENALFVAFESTRFGWSSY